MEETVIKEEPKIELADLIAIVGGILGLFLGFSFLSLIEIVEILANIAVILKMQNRRVKNEPQNVLFIQHQFYQSKNQDRIEPNRLELALIVKPT